MKAKPDKRKITVQLWSPMVQKLNELCTAACLNRDAYLMWCSPVKLDGW